MVATRDFERVQCEERDDAGTARELAHQCGPIARDAQGVVNAVVALARCPRMVEKSLKCQNQGRC